MPIYDYHCDNCGPRIDVWAKVDEQELECPDCGETIHRVLSATRSNPDWQPYYDENLVPMHGAEGTWVKSRQHRKEVMKQLGVVDPWSGL